MKGLVVFGILILSLFFAGCNDDHELGPDSAIVGDWDLGMIAYNDFPEGFDSNDGTLILEEELEIEMLTYSFRPDETFQSISRIAGRDLISNGEFNFSKQRLETVFHESIVETNSLMPNTGSLINDDRLTLNLEVEVMALPNEVIDTLSQQLSAKQFAQYAKLVNGQIYYFFDKVN